MASQTALPLAGITVVSIEQAVAAPFATRQLADLGARVIKVERPDAGDFARRYDETVHGESSYFVWLNRSKESLTLDLKSDEGRGILEKLLSTADVFVQNLAPGAAARMNLDAQSLQQRYPTLIPCDVSGYGNTGPWSGRKAYDMLVQGESGLMSLTGPDECPSKAGVSIADIAAGMYAYSGILSALYMRATTGTARAVEVALFEALGEWMGSPAYYTEYGAGSRAASERNTRRSPRTVRSPPQTARSCCRSRTTANGPRSARRCSATRRSPPTRASAATPRGWSTAMSATR